MEDDKIYMEDMTVRFSQEPDCTQDENDSQSIEVHLESNGVGNFMWIKTDRWSFADVDDLAKFVDRVRAMETTNYKIEEQSGSKVEKDVSFVDLGIVNDKGQKVLFADRNIGASAPEAYGKYFQWGDTVGYEGDAAKAHSSWTTAPFNNGQTDFDEAYFNTIKDTVCSDGVLASAYDAATVAYGEGYRLPTKDEMRLLIRNTTSEWTTQNGVNGYKFTSKIEGYTDRSIFVPAAGYVGRGSFIYQGSFGDVWSSSLYASYPDYAWGLYFSSGSMHMYCSYRCHGQSLRGVLVQD